MRLHRAANRRARILSARLIGQPDESDSVQHDFGKLASAYEGTCGNTSNRPDHDTASVRNVPD